MKKLLSVLLTIVMLALPVAEITAFAAPSAVEVADSAMEFVEMPMEETATLAAESGWCGETADNLTWTLDDEGTLTISGTGAMTDWSSYQDVPWYSYRSAIKSVEISDGVTSIGSDAFAGCTGLTSVTIPDSLTSIGSDAFYNCTGLTSVTIPDGVTSIGSFSFAGCTSLTSITIPGSVTSIGYYVFSHCYSLVVYCEKDSYAESYANDRGIKCAYIKGTCGEKLEWLISNETLTISGSGTMTNYSPSNMPLWFSSRSKIKNIVINEGITSIGDYAFYNCPGLTSITIPDSLTSIGSYAFYGCPGLTSITIPDSVTSIGSNAFYGISDVAHFYVSCLGESCVHAYATKNNLSVITTHQYGEWTVTKAPTWQEIGVETRICDDCGEKESKYLDVIPYVDVTGITLDKTSVNLGIGDSIKLAAMVCPEDASEKDVMWKSSDENVVIVVGDGNVIAIGKGTAIIISATHDNKFYDTCEINVGTPADAVEFTSLKSTSLAVGKTLSLSAKAYCKNGEKPESTKVVLEIVDGEEYATLDAKGKLKGIAPGKVTVRATAEEGTETAYADVVINVCIPATKVTLNTTKAAMIKGGKDVCLEATLSPENNTDTLTWSVDKPEIATVDEYGVVTAHKAGKVKVTALAGSGKKATCTITVGAPADTVEFTSLKSTSLAVGKTLSLKAKASCADKTKPVSTNVVMEIIEGQEYATIDAKGKLKGIATGEVIVRATAEAGTEDAYEDVVIRVCVPATKISLNMTAAALDEDDELQLKAVTAPDNNTDVVIWTSANEDIAVVDENGLVTALSTGIVKITATTGSGKSATCTVTVGVPATKVTLNTTKASMINGGKDLCLEATLSPENSTDTPTWSVDNPEIATVDEYGVVTAHSAGKVKVTALAGSGKSATCTVTVGEPATKVEFTSLKSTSLAVGKTLSLKAKASRDDKVKPVSTNVVFEIIEGQEYATIDAKGKLKGIATGEVVVRATAEAGTETAYADVVINVCIPATKVVLNKTKATVTAGEKVHLEATLSPENHTDTLGWSSSNKEVATVDKDGVVTTLKEGSVKITAMSGSGKKATCTIKVEKAATPATFCELVLTDISYKFIEDEYIVEANPGAVGGMEISATVMGPSDVKSVLIAKWGTDISDMSQKEIYEEAVWYANMWKSHGFEVGDYNRIPFETRTMHPIDEDELGLDLQVLLIGLDKDCNAVGYYILEQN